MAERTYARRLDTLEPSTELMEAYCGYQVDRRSTARGRIDAEETADITLTYLGMTYAKRRWHFKRDRWKADRTNR